MQIECINEFHESSTVALILYSGPWPGAVGRVAFLDREDDRIIMRPYAPDFDFKIFSGLSASEALSRAESFVSAHSSFHRSKISKITDDYERVIGYEIRPIFLLTTFGSEDILDIGYRQRDNLVDIYVRLDPRVERML